ncbi:MAG: histidine kinase dimerization/phosphoacceptor domain -containing protein [Pseudanabaenaceae cyanobacterium bins.39]|nr:histidine kinase dimerization/phosphoacceptor domain -containing protein [Pseudanabaenaceae cyanobacterium bins.39]
MALLVSELEMRSWEVMAMANHNPELQDIQDINLQLVQTIADQQITEDRLNLQLTRLKLMYDFVSALNAAQSDREIYQIALNGICPALGVSQAFVINSSHQGYLASIGMSTAFLKELAEAIGDRDANLTVAPRDSTQAILPSDRRIQEILQHENIEAWSVFPLNYEHRHLGDIIVLFEQPKHFTDEEIQLTETIVTYIAIAITRKQTQQALKESQQFGQRIADTIPSILYIYDLEEKRNIYCNHAVTNLLGYSKDSLQVAGVIDQMVHPEDLQRIQEHWRLIRNYQLDQKSPNLEKLFSIEYRMRDIYGEWRWFYSQETIFLCDQEGKVKQIIGAASDITKLKEVETKLQSSLAEKEVLLREVHHRVKNNLSVVDSLLSMQSRHIQDATALKALSDCQRRIHTMALIHEQLHRSQNLGKINFCEYLQSLVSNLYSSNNCDPQRIHLDLQISPDFVKHPTNDLLNIDTAISTGLIVNELLINAFKHAFPNQEQGLIEVILYYSDRDRTLHLIIQDDGIGIPLEINFQTTNSLGLRLVRILSQQIRASLNLSLTNGTSFHLAIKL